MQTLKGKILLAVLFCSFGMAAGAQDKTYANPKNDWERYWNLAVQEAQKGAQIKFGAPPGSDISNGEVRKITTTICRSTISHMLAEHSVTLAKRLYDEHQLDIDPEESDKLITAIWLALDNEKIALESGKNIGQHTDVDELRKSFDDVDRTESDPILRDRLKEAMLTKWTMNRSIAEADYKDNLVQATDLWYVNNGDYKKIPQPLWDKLHELDKYQFKHALPGKEVLSTARMNLRP